jgi:hypothetical protein
MNSNSKRSNHQAAVELPGPLSAAVAEAENLLARHAKLAGVLVATGTSIPKLLGEERRLSAALGNAEIESSGVDKVSGQLASVRQNREADARRRASATESLLESETDLTRARERVSGAQNEFASTMVEDFNRRWQEACRALAVLRSEAVQLSAALRTTVLTPAPYVVSVNAINGAAELRPIALAEPIPPVALTPALVTVGTILDRLDSAHGLIGSLKQAADLNCKHHAVARVRAGMQAELRGIYEVARAFHVLGSDFAVGALLDRSLLPDGLLHRYWLGRAIRPVEGAAVAVA